MPTGLEKLKHSVVLMMENRSFDQMRSGLQAQDPRIDGLIGDEGNPDTTGAAAPVKAQAAFQGQLDPDPNHHFPGVHLSFSWGSEGHHVSGAMSSTLLGGSARPSLY